MFWRSSSMRVTMMVMTVFVLASVLIIGAIYWQTHNILTNRNVARVIDETRTLSEIAARNGVPGLLRALRTRERAGSDMLYGLADGAGRTIWLGGLRQWPQNLLADNATGVFEISANARQDRTAVAGQTTALAIGATLRLPGGERLLVARDVTEQRDLARVIRNWFLIAIGLLSALALATAWIINRLLLQRIDALTQTTTSIMAGDYSKRVPLTAADDEFDALAVNVNAMLARIESLMQGLHEVSDNIAHDLKTPLNRLRMRAEEALRDPRGDAAYREGLEATLVEADDLIRTFNALLRVAHLEAGTLGGTLETFDATALMADLAEFYEPVAEEQAASLSVNATGSVWLNADRQLISQALTNLLENALKYGRSTSGMDAVAHLEIGARRTVDGADLWVADHGKGISADDHERVLKRFVRLDAARSQPGTGLGLSLVAAVLHRHGGSVTLVDNQPGLRVVLSLPAERLAPPPQAPSKMQQLSEPDALPMKTTSMAHT